MKYLLFTVLLLSCLPVFADSLSGTEILNKIDDNMFSESRIVRSKMVINGRRNSRTVEAKTWSEGSDRAFTEYLSPARERGTKMLKLADRLWTYSPSTDRTIKISGHMLRQPVMGSDLSYEDMMDDVKLSKDYLATVVGRETIEERPCYVLELEAQRSDLAYQKRKIWVDKERFIPLRQQLFAKSGKLLKTITLSDFKLVEERWFPFRMLFKDNLKVGEGTEFIIDAIEFNADIPAHIFSKASLRR